MPVLVSIAALALLAGAAAGGATAPSSDPVYAVPRKGPWIADVSERMAEIRWEVSDPAHPGALVVATARHPATVHGAIARARVESLEPDRAYDYHVDFSGARTATHVLRTLPLDGQPVSFAAIGDLRNGHVVHARLAARIAQERPDFVVSTGDLVADGRKESDWQAFFEAERALLAVAAHLPAVGNHDARGLLNESLWDGYFPENRYREVRAGVLRLLFVDTTQAFGAQTKQGIWLRERLQAAKEERESGKPVWILAIHHHPAFSSGNHGSEESVQRELVPLYEAHGVDLVLQGHDHVYERLEKGGVVYVTTGGGGAPLYKVRGLPETKVAKAVHHWLKIQADRDRLAFQALGLDGETIDARELRQGRERADRAAPSTGPAALLSSVGFVASCAAAAWLASARFAEKKTPASP